MHARATTAPVRTRPHCEGYHAKKSLDAGDAPAVAELLQTRKTHVGALAPGEPPARVHDARSSYAVLPGLPARSSLLRECNYANNPGASATPAVAELLQTRANLLVPRRQEEGLV